jgi:hypothetical protein
MTIVAALDLNTDGELSAIRSGRDDVNVGSATNPGGRRKDLDLPVDHQPSISHIRVEVILDQVAVFQLGLHGPS